MKKTTTHYIVAIDEVNGRAIKGFSIMQHLIYSCVSLFTYWWHRCGDCYQSPHNYVSLQSFCLHSVIHSVTRRCNELSWVTLTLPWIAGVIHWEKININTLRQVELQYNKIHWVFLTIEGSHTYQNIHISQLAAILRCSISIKAWCGQNRPP